jgi:long-chain acyl-CoA synthetase
VRETAKGFTYNRLDELTARLANGLKDLGVSQGDRVTLYSPNRWEWIVSYYAVLRLGAVINPINVMLTPDEVVFVTKDCGAKVLLASVDQLIDDNSAELPEFEIDPMATSAIGYTSGTTGHPKGAMLSHHGIVLNSALTGNLHAKSSSSRPCRQRAPARSCDGCCEHSTTRRSTIE